MPPECKTAPPPEGRLTILITLLNINEHYDYCLYRLFTSINYIKIYFKVTNSSAAVG